MPLAGKGNGVILIQRHIWVRRALPTAVPEHARTLGGVARVSRRPDELDVISVLPGAARCRVHVDPAPNRRSS